jgi:uncharacterized membrane protein
MRKWRDFIPHEAGYDVSSTDLVERGFGAAGVDFLLQYQALVQNIVTNPPFTLGTEFVRHALRLATGKVAMLLKIGFVEGPTKEDLRQARSIS